MSGITNSILAVAAELLLAGRSLWRRPMFALQFVVTLGVGFGCVTVVLFLADSTFERHHAMPKDTYLIAERSSAGGLVTGLWQAQFAAFADRTDVITEVGASCYSNASVTNDGRIVAKGIAEVTPSLLHIFKVRAQAGVLWSGPKDPWSDGLLISDSLCRALATRSNDILGRSLVVDHVRYPIIGVLANSERLPMAFRGDVFRLLRNYPLSTRPWDRPLLIVAKLRPGITGTTAAGELQRTPIAAPQSQQAILRANSIALLPVAQMDDFQHPQVLLLLAVAVGLLFTCATFNAAGLMMVRTIDRMPEFSLRFALGARSSHICRIQVFEVGILALMGSLFGLAVAYWVAPIFAVAVGAGHALPVLGTVGLSLGSLLVGLAGITAAAVAIMTLRLVNRACLTGIAIRNGSAELTRNSLHLRYALIVIQTMLAIVLLGTAGLVFTTVHT